MGLRPPLLPWFFKETENLGVAGNFYHALLCLWFHLHFPTNFSAGVKTAIRVHLRLTVLIAPISPCKVFQPAALQPRWYLCAGSPQRSAVSWEATADQKITAASGGAAGGIFQPLIRSLPRPKSWSNHGQWGFAAKTVPQVLQTSLLDGELTWGMIEMMRRFLQCGGKMVRLLKLLLKRTWSTSSV